ncbi:hypothetical protein [Streptomyces sp. NRRL F-5630]|uniref:hypothetical protein n=1 Tax=Streptomyces sp. NRRL F-5630 TaxID=1463864 RepID=UPI003EC12C46
MTLYDMCKPRQRMSLYRTVLHEGRPNDLPRYLKQNSKTVGAPAVKNAARRSGTDTPGTDPAPYTDAVTAKPIAPSHHRVVRIGPEARPATPDSTSSTTSEEVGRTVSPAKTPLPRSEAGTAAV